MSRSSIFSFDTLAAGPVRRLLTAGFGWFVLFLLVLEIGVRMLVPDGNQPTGGWHNEELREQARQLAQTPHVDVMFTGSSVPAVNLPPVAFDAALAGHGVELVSFNASVRGCNFSCVFPVFRELFWSRRKAPVVIIAVTPHGLDESNWLVTERSGRFLESLEIPALTARSRDIFGHLWLFGFRNEIRHYLRHGEWLHEPSLVTVRGHTDMGSAPGPRYEWDFVIDRHGEAASGLFALVDWLTDQGVRVLVIPGTMDSSSWAMLRPAMRTKFDAMLAELAAPEGVRYVETRDLTPPDNEFIDQLHLSTEAARRYARAVAARLAPYLKD